MSDKPPATPGGPQLRRIAMPADANPSGDVFGGWTLSQMDLAGGVFAAERAEGRVATVAVGEVRFLAPIAVGDEVSCYCSEDEIGDTSITVHIETWTRNRADKGAHRKVTEGRFTYVAMDQDGKPRSVDGAS